MQFLKKIFIYFTGTVFHKLIIFILLPVYTRHLSPSSYGDADLAITTVTMLVSLLFMEVWTPLLRFSYDSKEIEDKKKIYCNVVIVALFCLPLYFAGCIFMAVWQNLPYMVWMIVYGLSLLIMHILQFEVRAIGKSQDFMISGMISSVLQLIISFVCIYGFNVGAEIVIISPAVSNIIASLYLELKYKLAFVVKKANFSMDIVKRIVKYAIPLAVNAVAFWAMTNINRYFSREYLGTDANGYIALATKFIALVNTLVQIYSLAWQESAYEHSNSSQRCKYYSKMLIMYLDIMSVGTALAIIGTNIVFPFFIGKDYEATQLILPIYYISAFASAVSNFYGHIFNSEKKTGILLYSTILGAIINILMLYFTITKWGIYAVPISLVLGYCVNVGMRIFSISFTVKMKIKPLNLLIDLIFIAASAVLIYAKAPLIIKAVLIGAALMYLVLMYKKHIYEVINKIMKRGNKSGC